MRRQWDVVVIGAGVAGLSAAEAAAQRGASCACVDRLGPGGTAMNLGHVQGYPDAANDHISGADFIAQLLDGATEAGVELVFGEVQGLAGGPPWVVTTDEEEHEARAVIVATGLSAGSLGVANEADYEGRGLSHCAASDGPLFAGQDVVVTGNYRWTVQEAEELAAMVASVTLVAETDSHAEGVTVLPGRIVALKGADGLDAVVVAHEGAQQEVPARGLFAYLDRQPQLAFAGDLLPRDANGRVEVDETFLSRVPFIFAVGDVRAGSAETVADAVSDGRAAGLAAAGLLKR